MLPCVCSVIDHRWRQNVVTTKKWHTRRRRVCHRCSYLILTSSVIYYWIRRTSTWNLFVLYNNEKPFFTLQRKQNWTANSSNLEENVGKIKSVFVIGAALWAEKLGRCLENYRSWKYPRKTCGYSQPRSHLIRVLNERSVNDGGDFCLLWLVILKSAWHSVGDTF